MSVAALMLVEEGKLELDAPISQYLRCWKDADVCVVPAGNACRHPTACFRFGRVDRLPSG